MVAILNSPDRVFLYVSTSSFNSFIFVKISFAFSMTTFPSAVGTAFSPRDRVNNETPNSFSNHEID